MMSTLTQTNEAYCREILSLAQAANFIGKHLPPDDYSKTARIFRSGERNRNPQIALRSACDAIRGELAARGFDLPDTP